MADTALENLNDQLQPIYTNLSNLQGVETNAVAKQQDMLKIVDFEQDRLEKKQEMIDQAVENQKRIIYFNDNSRKIYSAWLYILITITIVLAIIFLIRILYSNYGAYLPEMGFNIAMIAVISIGAIIIYRLWAGIRARDHYNFDELNLNPPNIGTPSNTSSGFGFGLVGCIGKQCCTPATMTSPGTKWDPTLGKCLYTGALTSPSDTSNTSDTSGLSDIFGVTYTTPTPMPTTPSSTVPYSSTPPAINPSSTPTPTMIQGTSSIQANEPFETGYGFITKV
jgi:hypothetical protein